jgi:hypothetical protein
MQQVLRECVHSTITKNGRGARSDGGIGIASRCNFSLLVDGHRPYRGATRFTIMKLRLLCLALAAALATAIAQNPQPQPPPTPPPNNQGSGNPRVNDAENRTGFWDCNVPGGNFTIALGKISSVSIHEFNLTGGRVTEVTVDTEGSVCARFYFMEPLKVGGAFSASEVVKERITEIADTAAERTGTDKVWRKVQKDYPIATHAHTVEFRLQFKEDLQAIHRSVKGAWMVGRGRTINVVEPQQQ